MRLSPAIVRLTTAATFLLQASVTVAAGGAWQTQITSDNLTNDRSLIASEVLTAPIFKMQVQMICTPPKSFSYRFTIVSPTHVTFMDNDPNGTSFRIRLDEGSVFNGVVEQHSYPQGSASIEIRAPELVQDYHESVRASAAELLDPGRGKSANPDWIDVESRFDIPEDPNLAILLGAANARVRLVFPTTAGEAFIDINQRESGPASVLKMCGLNHEEFVTQVRQAKTMITQALQNP